MHVRIHNAQVHACSVYSVQASVNVWAKGIRQSASNGHWLPTAVQVHWRSCCMPWPVPHPTLRQARLSLLGCLRGKTLSMMSSVLSGQSLLLSLSGFSTISVPLTAPSYMYHLHPVVSGNSWTLLHCHGVHSLMTLMLVHLYTAEYRSRHWKRAILQLDVQLEPRKNYGMCGSAG